VKPVDIGFVHAINERLYKVDFLGRVYLAEYVAQVQSLCDDLETWGQIWNDADFLAARVEALRDGTADMGNGHG
jgi:hypothetical protein